MPSRAVSSSMSRIGWHRLPRPGYPTPVAGLGIPYLIGPVAWSLDDPPGFTDDSSPWYVRLRGLDRLRLRRDPLLRRTYLEASCVIGIAPEAREMLSDFELRRFEIMSPGLTALPALGAPPPSDGMVHLLYVGRLVRTKGSARRNPCSVAHEKRRHRWYSTSWVMGPIGLPPRHSLGNWPSVAWFAFTGCQPRDRVEQFYRAADIFVFPSYREPGGNVVFEAMVNGVPLVVGYRGGPASSLDDRCAIRVLTELPGSVRR